MYTLMQKDSLSHIHQANRLVRKPSITVGSTDGFSAGGNDH